MDPCEFQSHRLWLGWPSLSLQTLLLAKLSKRLKSGPPWKCKLMLRLPFFSLHSTTHNINCQVKQKVLRHEVTILNMAASSKPACWRAPSRGSRVHGRRGGGEGGWSPGVELSCVAPGCVRVLACDMVRGAHRRERAACQARSVRDWLASVFSASAYYRKRANEIEQQATCFHSYSGFIRWSQSQWDVGFEVMATGYSAF